MGCCHSDHATETTPLLNDASVSNEASIKRRSTSSYINKPICKCGEAMNLYELQCCYLNTNTIQNNNDIGLYNGTIDCQQCMVEMCDPTTLLWHCMNNHNNEYRYDLCIQCAEIIYTEQKQEKDEKKHKEIIEEKYCIFDKKYDIPNENIYWNQLYQILNDDGKIFKVWDKINKYICKTSNYTEILSPKILKFIKKCEYDNKIAISSHDRLHKHDSWINVVDNIENISIWYRKEKNSDIHSLKMKMMMKCTALDILCVLNEFDLIQELVTIIPINTTLIKQESITSKIIYIKANLWFPLKNRDIIAHAQAYDLGHIHTKFQKKNENKKLNPISTIFINICIVRQKRGFFRFCHFSHFLKFCMNSSGGIW